MPIGESDFLAWYNSEISRYRDHEWKLCSYSAAISLSIIFFSYNAETKGLIPSLVASLAILFTVFLLMFAQCHTHKKLNEFRQRRTLLLEDKAHNAKNANASLFKGSLDTFYFLGFLFVPLAFGLGAAWTVYGAK